MNKHATDKSATWQICAALSACGLTALLWSNHCAAEGRGRDCSAVYDAAREEERGGHLRDAAQLYQNCALDSCTSPVRQSCQAKLFRLELDVPSVVPLAKAADGQPLVNAEVSVDGAVLTSRLDGRAYPLDPGLHEFVWSADGKTFGSTRLVVAQGQRNLELWMSVPAPVATQPIAAAPVEPISAPAVMAVGETSAAQLEPEIVPTPHRASSGHAKSVSITPYVLGGTALLGAGAYALLSTWARNDNQQLANCSPNCPRDSISHIRNLYIAADISLGVAAAAAVGSIATFMLSGSSSKEEQAPKRSYTLSVQPGRSGALATFRGTL
jgi:hypothetical protein